jgi:hypothetical protein
MREWVYGQLLLMAATLQWGKVVEDSLRYISKISFSASSTRTRVACIKLNDDVLSST